MVQLTRLEDLSLAVLASSKSLVPKYQNLDRLVHLRSLSLYASDYSLPILKFGAALTSLQHLELKEVPYTHKDCLRHFTTSLQSLTIGDSGGYGTTTISFSFLKDFSQLTDLTLYTPIPDEMVEDAYKDFKTVFETHLTNLNDALIGEPYRGSYFVVVDKELKEPVKFQSL